MINKRYITQWQQSAPWTSPSQVEQDLIISRALVEIFGAVLDNTKRCYNGEHEKESSK